MKAITTRYHGPTNYRSARVTASDNDGNRATVAVDYVSDTSSHDAAALALCAKMGWYGTLHRGSVDRGYVYVWDTGSRDTVRAL